jgi:hypothetical protein
VDFDSEFSERGGFGHQRLVRGRCVRCVDHAEATVLPQVSAPPPAVALPTTRVLDIPLHRQEHALSCEVAALEMAMGALGTQVPEES